jgi:putative MATE family efflux protein
MKKYKNDFTKGNIRKHLITFAAPFLISSLLQNCYNIVDTICVGQMVGEKGLAAVGNSFPVMMLIISLFIGFSIGLIILIGQFAGANDTENLKRCFQTGNAFFLVGTVVMTVVGLLLCAPLLRLMNTPAEAFADAQGYLTIIFGGMVFSALYNLASSYLRGLGDSKTPMYFVLIATLLNIPLDIALIGGFWFIPKLGVPGAAWATIISQAVSAILCIAYLSKKNHIIEFKLSGLRFHRDIFKKIVKLGLFTAIQQSLLSVSFTVMTGFVNSFGTLYAAAFAAGAKLDAMVIIPGQAIGQSVSAVAAQNIGVKQYGRAKSALRWSVLFAAAFNLVIAAALYIFGRDIMVLFTPEPDVMDAGAMYLRYAAFFYVPFGIMACFNGLLQGAGDTRSPMLFTLFSAYFIRIPAALLLAYVFKMGINGIFLGMILGPIATMVISIIYYTTGRWTKKRVAEKIYDEEGNEITDVSPVV